MGNTELISISSRALPVHPHVCGEYFRMTCQAPRLCGSSPRVWGIHRQKLPSYRLVRFIPTCVGNTKRNIIGNDIRAVHPHVCGEYCRIRVICFRLCGSSPRVWGIHFFIFIPRMQGRFIPTCVGNTHRFGGYAGRQTVHPHVCGEYNDPF